MSNDYIKPTKKQAAEIEDFLKDTGQSVGMSDGKANSLKGFSNEELSILAQEMENALSTTEAEGMYKVASVYGGDGSIQQRNYPTPFMSLSDTKIPRSTTEIFAWCKYYYMFDPLISGAINALATFPITDIYLEENKYNNENKGDVESGQENENANQKISDESENLKFYKRVLFDEIDLINCLIGAGIDYFLYGNCIIMGSMGTDTTTGKIKWKNITRLDPAKILIDYNPVTQEKKYRWMIPDKIVKLCKDKKPKEEYDKVPEVIKEAVKNNKTILLNSDCIYHFQRIADSSGDNMIWGIPVIANVMKLLMYRNILRQAQEAIAREHIVPMRVLYIQPSKGEGFNPMSNWDSVAENLAREIQKSVRDPNYKVVSPVPIGLQNIGGEGRALLLTAEIEQVQNEILAGMNVPREFIFGGVSYSGSSIALKILENLFITYRLKIKDFIQNFLIKKMARINGEWLNDNDNDNIVIAKMVDMRMQDDVQQKQLIIDLNSRGKVSDEYLWKVFGLDPDKTKDAIEAEAKSKIESDFAVQMLQADKQFELQKKQVEQQMALQKYQMELSQKYGVAPQPEEGGEQGGGMPQGNQASQGEQPPQEAPQEAQGGKGGESTEEDLVKVAQQLMGLKKNEREKMLATLPKAYQEKILEIMNQIEVQQAQEGREGADMRPMPEQKPPRRNSLK